jgi:bifunctional non-homologous end joining protein LigD
LVVEVEYLSWNRQRGMLRHPSFEGLRLDKPAAEVVLETSSSDRPRAGEPAAIEGRTTKAPAADPPAAEAPATEAPATEAPATEAPRAARRRTVASRAASRKGDDPAVVGGVTISHPDRVVYPDVGLTKLDVARYYEEVGASILPYVARRPLTLVRCPQDYAGQCFFQKHAADGFPESIIRVPIKENGGTADYIAVDSLGGLLALVQFGALEFHVWGARLEDLDHPDQMVFDLDPAEDLPFAAVVDAARILRGLLRGLGLESFVKTSGGKGLHLVVPLAPTRTWDEVKDFSHALVDAMVAAEPVHFVATMALKKRPGKVFIDYLRNGRGATFVAPYSTRRRAGAPLSLPLRWDELGPSSRGDQYSLLNVHRRMASIKADPWEAYERTRQELTDWMLASAGVKEKRGAA